MTFINRLFILCATALLCLSPAPAPANMMVSGTGFFVTGAGHIVTNNHVVKGCKKVLVRGTVADITGKVIATDEKYDLALIKVPYRPQRYAYFSNRKSDMRINDPVMVIGYPGDAALTGKYKVAMGKIVGLQGPQHEPYWMQFSDAAMKGNSGGPLLDSTGNVIGVIVGKSQLYRTDARTGATELIQRSDIAISLPIVKDFLHHHSVYFMTYPSRSYYSIDQVENQARHYIVNVMCAPDDQ